MGGEGKIIRPTITTFCVWAQRVGARVGATTPRRKSCLLITRFSDRGAGAAYRGVPAKMGTDVWRIGKGRYQGKIYHSE